MGSRPQVGRTYSSEQAREGIPHSNHHTNTTPRKQTRQEIEEEFRRIHPRRRARARAQGLSLNTEAAQRTQKDNERYGKPDLNKPLPPTPPRRKHTNHSYSSSSRPGSPIDRAAHWVHKKVLTPTKQFIKDIGSPKATQTFDISSPKPIHEQTSDFDYHRVRVMSGDSPRRSSEEWKFYYDMNPSLKRDTDTPSRPVHRCGPMPASRPGHVRGPSFYDFEHERASATPPIRRPSTHDRHDTVPESGKVRQAFEHSLDAAQQMGHHLGLNHQAGRMAFSDSAPPGMMDPCIVCGKEPKGTLRFGKCSECR